MAEFNHYIIKFLDNSKETLSPEEYDFVIELTKNLKFNRGHILDYIIRIEILIDAVIERYILPKNSKLRKVFRSKILNNRAMTFNSKIELLCAIIKEKEELKGDDLTLLNKNLNSLRVERNKWAHGNIYFKEERRGKILHLQPYLNSIKFNGEEKNTLIAGSYFDELTNKLEINRKFLTKILIKRKLLPKDYLLKK